MAAVKPLWLTTAEASSLALKAEEEKQKAKLKSLRRKEQKKRRIARKREAKRAKSLMEMENKILKVQCTMRELVEEERQKSEKFLSLARKYYGMWKTLHEECRQKSLWNSQSSQAKDSNSKVRFYDFFFRLYRECVFKSPQRRLHCMYFQFSGKDFDLNIFSNLLRVEASLLTFLIVLMRKRIPY